MNRSSFFQGLFAVPVIAPIAKFLPKPDRVPTAANIESMGTPTERVNFMLSQVDNFLRTCIPKSGSTRPVNLDCRAFGWNETVIINKILPDNKFVWSFAHSPHRAYTT
jgi:hypothetical protein